MSGSSTNALTSSHLLKSLRDWKAREREHLQAARSLAPPTTPDIAVWLDRWAEVLAQSEWTADQWLRRETTPPDDFHAPDDPFLSAAGDEKDWAPGLLSHALAQSSELLSQLEQVSGISRDRALHSDWSNQPPPLQIIAQLVRDSTAYADRLAPYAQKADEASFRVKESSGAWTTAAEGVWARPTVPDQPPVPIGGHTLPPLPYPYNALEPYIDAKTMQLHHDIHHKAYVDGLNKAELEMKKARETGDFSLIKHWEREAAFNGAGHYLHTLFWNIMSPQGGGKPTGALAAQIDRDFGSFEAFKKHFSQAAEKVEGGGWAILVWSPRSHRLEILQAEKHQDLSQWDVIPLLALDVWEHAYYLKYKNERPNYVEAWWNVVNWPHVNERFVTARQVKWHPY
ncbi:superoxide dismutase [Gorillibacterium sp. CAU 1737]|uniref:superoxide dismutase n=1 Tax=Gorillibacterium sp. CAU 1737 TaxID=3140362 RepID=UPI0032608300